MEFWEQMGKELTDKIEEIKKSLAYGNVSSYDEYRQAVGTVQGFHSRISFALFICKINFTSNIDFIR